MHGRLSDEARRELEYYKKNLEELAAEHHRLDRLLWNVRRELKQRRQGFHLLSELSQAIGAQTQISTIFGITVLAVNTALGMDRTAVLVPTEQENRFRFSRGAGFSTDRADELSRVLVDAPPELAAGKGFMLVNSATPATPLIEAWQRNLEAPFFVCVPIAGETGPIGLLFTGRQREDSTMYPPLDEGDLDTVQAIAGLISAAVLNTQVAVLAEADRLKTEFFANISHEFRTPITLTLGPLEQILNGRYGPLPDAAREKLLVVQRSQDRLLGLVNQILELARLEAGRLALRVRREPSINAFIEERVRQFRPAAELRGVELRMKLDPVIADAALYLDRDRFDRLLTNLLANAINFTERGSIEVATEIHRNMFRLTVTDTGIGINDDEIPFVFDRFRQADGSHSRTHAGTGIGLALVKEIAELHGGDVSVRSRYGVGSSFIVRIPLGIAHLSEATIDEKEAEGPGTAAAAVMRTLEAPNHTVGVDEANRAAQRGFDPEKPLVLYVEDDKDLRDHVATVLCDDCNVFLAADGADGLDKVRLYRPDLVVTDQMMPHVSGRDFLHALRADPELRSTPVIFLTALAGTEARIESLDSGADDYLTKPFHEGELKARVRNLIRARRQERELAALNRRLETRVTEQLAELTRTGELKRFLAQPLVESVLAGELREAGEFERRKITVLFADLVGSTELSDHLQPEEFSFVLNEFLREMTSAAVPHGATVEASLGDAVMAIFGAPQDSPDDEQAWAAVQTALAMLDAAKQVTTEARRRGIAAQLSVRIGINSGYATVGVFGSETHRTYTAVGLPVNVAARLQSEAAPDTILCGLTVHALVAERVRSVSRPPMTLRGSRRPIEAFEILGLSSHEAPGDEEATMPNQSVPAPAGRVFERGGEFWTIAYEGSVFRLKDSKGLRHIALLLSHPYREVHVLDLVSQAEGIEPGRRQISAAEIESGGLTTGARQDAGPILDEEARAAYRRRLHELREEVDEAEAFNDPERAERAREEIEALTHELTAGIGLGGRDRMAVSVVQRTRVNVVRTIRAAIEKIAQNEPTLGAHLLAGIRTGVFCTYAPDPAAAEPWRTTAGAGRPV